MIEITDCSHCLIEIPINISINDPAIRIVFIHIFGYYDS